MAKRLSGSRAGTLKGHASTTLDDALKYKLTPPQARRARRRRNKSTYPSQKAAQAAARTGGKTRNAGAKEHQARKPSRSKTKKRTTKIVPTPKNSKGQRGDSYRLTVKARNDAIEKRREVKAEHKNRTFKSQNSTTKEALADRPNSTNKKQANALKRKRVAAAKAQNQRRKTVKRKAKKVTAKKVAKASNSRKPQPTRSTTSRSTSRPTTTTSTTTRWTLRPSTYKPVYKPPKPKGAHGNKKGRGHQGSFNTR